VFFSEHSVVECVAMVKYEANGIFFLWLFLPHTWRYEKHTFLMFFR